MTHLLEYETIKTSTIIQYPHAVSYFCELNLSYDYIAMTYSKKKGVPVLVSIVGKKVNQGLEVEEALRLYWGNRGKCISKIEAFSTGNAISAHTEGIETLRNEFKEIFPNCGGLVATLGVADGLFCREIDGLFCRSSPDSVVRRRCVLSLPSCFVI